MIVSWETYAGSVGVSFYDSGRRWVDPWRMKDRWVWMPR